MRAYQFHTAFEKRVSTCNTDIFILSGYWMFYRHLASFFTSKTSLDLFILIHSQFGVNNPWDEMPICSSRTQCLFIMLPHMDNMS